MPYKDVLPGTWVVAKYEGERFFRKLLQKRCGEYIFRCLSMPFGVNTPQQSEEDEGTCSTEVYDQT